MKKVIPVALLGFVAGAATIWFCLRHPGETASEKHPAAEEPHTPGLHLTREQQAGAGLEVALPKAIEVKPETRAFGRVLDIAPLAGLMTDIATAQSSLNATAKEFERLKSLGENASPRSLETAEAAMKRDQAALEAAQARLLAGWGRPLTSRADFSALTRSLLALEAALVRVEVPAGEVLPAQPRNIRLARLTGNAPAVEAELLGPAPTADMQAQGQAFLAVLRDKPSPPGTLLAAWLETEGAGKRGFHLPRAAVLQIESGQFVFVQTSDTTFERKRIEAKSQRDGMFVTSGLGAEDRVVVTGAQQLLSEELKGASGGE